MRITDSARSSMAAALSRSLAAVLPREVTLTVIGPIVRCVPEGDPEGYVEIDLSTTEVDSHDSDLLELRAEAALGAIQDCIIEARGRGWPELAPDAPASWLALPYARVEGTSLRLGYVHSERQIDLPAIELSRVAYERA